MGYRTMAFAESHPLLSRTQFREEGVSKMKEKDLGARWDVRMVGGSHRYPIDTHHSRNRRQGVRTSGLEL